MASNHSQMRVVVATPCWRLNGPNIFAANLVRGLRDQGIAAEILLTEQDTRLVRAADIPDPAIPLPADIPVNMLPVSPDADWGAHWRAMIHYLEMRTPCIYLPNYDWRHSCVSPRLSRQVSIVGVLHGDSPLYYDHAARLGQYWNATVAVSKVIAEHVTMRLPALANRVVTIPYGVSIPDAPPLRGGREDEPLRMVYANRLVQHEKRALDLPRIMAALEELGIPAVLSIIGGGSDQQALLAACQPFVEQGSVKYLGVLRNDQVLERLAQNDVFILTSDSEGMPISLLEAMGQGCVAVVTDIRSGIPELISDGVNGFRVPVGDVASFADRLALLQRNAQGRRAMGLQAYHSVVSGGYRTEDMVRKYRELFDRVFDELRTGLYRRPQGRLLPPPRQVAGTKLLPGDYDREAFETELTLVGPRWMRAVAITARYYASRGLRRVLSTLHLGERRRTGGHV